MLCRSLMSLFCVAVVRKKSSRIFVVQHRSISLKFLFAVAAKLRKREKDRGIKTHETIGLLWHTVERFFLLINTQTTLCCRSVFFFFCCENRENGEQPLRKGLHGVSLHILKKKKKKSYLGEEAVSFPKGRLTRRCHLQASNRLEMRSVSLKSTCCERYVD